MIQTKKVHLLINNLIWQNLLKKLTGGWCRMNKRTDFPDLDKQEKELEIMEKNLEIGTLKLKMQLYEIEKKPYSKFTTIVKS